MKFTIAAAVLALVAPIAASPAEVSSASFFEHFQKRASFPVPASKGSVTYKKVQPVKGVFDGGMKTYGRGVKCTGQKEGGDADAVFLLEDGATLKNAIIGKDQIEGVHCKGSCTIQNVWWVDVCEDALSLKGDGNASVIGGGAQSAEDKVIQHNGKGTVTIDGFTVMDFGKLYRACGNCKNSVARQVVIKNVKAFNGKVLAGINPNFGDKATISGTCASSVKTICEEFKGTKPGSEPKSVSKGPSNNCKYTASQIKTC
ncbi:polysaccharide lyase family 3 protein [Aaosphaeria arxii CBS 175.79]|uniref:Pectate lyase n=1 Tax=Aaosphaeria arxii CBS 175.79 TaxID=1450172 RepID=A0A6A5Y0J8_9PLEO|nr:polysaccharide lyase family 3 protein [Aaosphaeria arxii CBS 175.79]KAF2018789.1 polysaccharide lyase family 3 protein [Aaosphaeria arxii CBS 175.79]